MSDEMPDPFQCLRDSVDRGFDRVLAGLQRSHESLEHRLDRRANRIDAELHTILLALGKVIHMSGTLSEQLDQSAARDEAASAKLSADLAAIAEELKANAPPVGSVMTQAQVDRHAAIATALEAAAAAADALVVPVAPPAP